MKVKSFCFYGLLSNSVPSALRNDIKNVYNFTNVNKSQYAINIV